MSRTRQRRAGSTGTFTSHTADRQPAGDGALEQSRRETPPRSPGSGWHEGPQPLAGEGARRMVACGTASLLLPGVRHRGLQADTGINWDKDGGCGGPSTYSLQVTLLEKRN